MSYWSDRWLNTKVNSLNYDTMIGWSKEQYDDETSILKTVIKEFMEFSTHSWINVLDFGCGKGRFCDMFGEFYTGIDLIPEMIEENKAKYPDRCWMYMDEPATLENNDYDFVFCFTVIQHLNDGQFEGFLDRIKSDKVNIFIGESIAADYSKLRENEFNRPQEITEAILKKHGYEIKKSGKLKSREEYYFLWATPQSKE